MRIPDYPKLWLAVMIALGWAIGRLAPHGPQWLAWVGGLAASGGLALLIAAAMQMRRMDTPSDPYGAPRHLVTGGLFAHSRNPIYLADAIILGGLTLAFRAPLAVVPLVAAFVTIITLRFIHAEEARLAAAFPAAFAAYCARTRRWL
ncbi:MAG: methyltransferase [Paracoccus sp. (in: a-proteobacteria)]|nr:methyltransferase [Paracoccus sp. (in: a-proteobacteria)]